MSLFLYESQRKQTPGPGLENSLAGLLTPHSKLCRPYLCVQPVSQPFLCLFIHLSVHLTHFC